MQQPLENMGPHRNNAVKRGKKKSRGRVKSICRLEFRVHAAGHAGLLGRLKAELAGPWLKLFRIGNFCALIYSAGMSSIGKLMKQAARMQQQMEQVQAQLAARTVEATSGGGAVKVIAKCDGSLASIKIDPQALNPSDAQLVEDMIVTAANQALGQAKEISNAEMGKVTAGLNLPGFG